MIKVLIMNGAFGFKFRYSDTMHAAVKEVFDEGGFRVEGWEYAEPGRDHKTKCKFSGSRRGSIFKSSSRYIKRWIKKNVNSEDVLICFGKSAGAYRLLQAINELKPSQSYKAVYFMSVDMNFHSTGGKNMNHSEMWCDDKGLEHWMNIYQSGEIGGYEAGGDSTHDNCFLTQDDITHFNITKAKTTRDYIKTVFEWSIGSSLR